MNQPGWTESELARSEIRDWIVRVADARRQGFLRARPLFEPHAPADEAVLATIETRIGTRLPEAFRTWLLDLGFGDVDGCLSFRAEWIFRVEAGPLQGCVAFAQDDLGSFYVFRHDGSVAFLSRLDFVLADLTPDFTGFIAQLVQRDFALTAWTDSLPQVRYG